MILIETYLQRVKVEPYDIHVAPKLLRTKRLDKMFAVVIQYVNAKYLAVFSLI